MALSPEELKQVLTDPREIVKGLDKYIIGQEKAKKALALLCMNRSVLLLSKFGKLDEHGPLNISKMNVLLMGETGSGKTSLIKALSKVTDMPITIFDCTSITEAGYIGGKVEDILVRYIQENFAYYQSHMFTARYPDNFFADNLMAHKIFNTVIETGIIYIDEIDKIARTDSTGWKGKNESIQNELLKFLEGSVVDIGNQYGESSKTLANLPCKKIDTKDLFFVLGGAFKGLDEVIRARLNKNTGIGFSSELPDIGSLDDKTIYLDQVTTEDLIEYGFKPEFVGRIPSRAALSNITKPIMERIILNAEESPFKRYQDFFKVFGVELEIDAEGLSDTADLALELKTGARAIQNILFSILESDLINIYDVVPGKLVITREMVKNRSTLNEV